MSINTGDIVFSREGRPVLVTSKDPKSGNVTVENNLRVVQDAAENGLKNGLREGQKEAYQAILSEASDPDKRVEIDKLLKSYEALKREKVDPRLLRYVQSELQHRIMRENYHPDTVVVDPATLISY